MKELDLLRQELLSCDTQLVDILMKRFDVVEKIMALKEKNQMQILQPEQESRQKEALDIELKGNVHQEEIADIYARVLYNSKKIQGKKLFDYNIVLIGFMGAGKSTISAFLRDALAMDVVEMDQVIAEHNVAEMKKNGKVVLLKADPQTILDRVKDSDERPILNGHKNVEYIADLMEARRAKYEAAADIVVQTDGKSALEICEEMIHKLRSADE